jgi:SNF2 family DNA or RNA helicase
MKKVEMQQEDSSQSVKYHPLTIIVPASVILQWVDKDRLKVMIFWGNSEHVSDTSRKERTVNNWDDLRAKLRGLDVDDPQTGHTVVVTSYQTWAKRTTKSNNIPGRVS